MACRFSVSFSSSEYISLNISNGSYSWCLLVIYRPPSENVNTFIRELIEVLAGLFSESQLCLAGDLNIDVCNQDRSCVANYLNTLADYGAECTITSPTRKEFLSGNLVSSCIDHINIRTSNYSINSVVIKYKLADHYFTTCQCIPLGIRLPTSIEERHITITDFKKLDTMVAGYDWSNFARSLNPSNAYLKFSGTFSTFYSSCRRRFSVKLRKREHEWLNSDILNEIKL